MNLKEKLASLAKKAKQKASSAEGKKIVREYYIIRYKTPKGQSKSIRARDYDEALAKARKLADKGYHDILVTTEKKEINVQVSSRKILTEKLTRALKEAEKGSAKSSKRPRKKSRKQSKKSSKKSTNKRRKSTAKRRKRKKNTLPDLW